MKERKTKTVFTKWSSTGRNTIID